MRKILLSLILVASAAAHAQDTDKCLFNHLSTGLNLGTNGIGIEVGTTIAPIVEMRAGVDIMPTISFNSDMNYDRPEQMNNLTPAMLEERYVNIPPSGGKLNVRTKTFLTQGKVLFDIYTSKKSKFHFTVGAYFGSSVIGKARSADKAIAAVELYNQDIKDGNVLPEPGYPNGISIDMEGYKVGHDQGRVELQAKVNAFRPYIGIGTGRTVPRDHRLGFKFDFGVQFWGTPKLYDRYKDHIITKDEPGISGDFQDALKIADKVIVYPTIKFSLFGRIL